MQLVYLCLPEIPNKRNFIVGDRHIINTAAPPDNRFYYYKYERKQKPVRYRLLEKIEAPQ